MVFMRRWGIRLAAILLVACGGDGEEGPALNTAYAQPPRQTLNDSVTGSRQNAITRAVQAVSPAVVGINVTQTQRVRRRPFNDPFWEHFFPELYRERYFDRKVESLGSGFLISPDGYLVTNEHVVSNASEIIVTMTDGRRFEAKAVGSDHFTDIALLKIDSDAPLPFIPFGRTTDLMVGEWVIALGNPFGLFELNDQPTVTVGVVSATDRDWGRTAEGRLYLDMIQTDAAINRGNSGGPLVNSAGEVIGMNAFIFTGSQGQGGFIGIGFAIPIEKIDEVVSELRERGEVNREYWLGIFNVRSLNARIIAALGLSVREGVIVTQLDPDGPAYRAGMREYDVVTAVEGIAVNNRETFVETLRNMDLRVGTQLRFRVVREDKTLDLTITLEPMPDMRR